jgi:hypothetical protein
MILESDPTLVREVKPEDLTSVAKACRKGNVSHRQGQGGFIYPGKYAFNLLKPNGRYMYQPL